MTAANTNAVADGTNVVSAAVVSDVDHGPALAAKQAAELTPAERATAERLRLAGLPLALLVDHLLDVIDEGRDPDTGELEAAALDVIDALNLDVQRKVEATYHVIARMQAEHGALHTMASSLGEKAAARDRDAKRLKARLMAEMQRMNVTKLKTQTVTAYIQANAPSVELNVLTDDQVPDEYCVTERRASMSKIAAALKAGAELAFAQLTRGVHIRFR